MLGLVGSGIGVIRRCKTDSRLGGVKDTVEALKEALTVDKIKALSGRSADVVDNPIDCTRSAANVAVERSRPDLTVGGQRVRDLQVDVSVGCSSGYLEHLQSQR